MSSLRLCLATQNPHKVEELRALIAFHAPELEPRLPLISLAALGIHDEVLEDGADFAANATKKAKAAHERSKLWALADDSGLEVTALSGAPGIYSARYGGAPRPGQTHDARNREALLDALREVPMAQRQARFVCVLCLYGASEPGSPATVILTRGECKGRLLFTEEGSGGFGYDPLFVPDEEELGAARLDRRLAGRTYAELLPEDKNRLSHRGRALAVMLSTLRALADGQALPVAQAL